MLDASVDPPFLTETSPGRPERFGKYEVTRHLADGGMAEVYLARATGIEGFEKNVVIKRLKPQLARSFPMATELFLQEARIAATLEHPQIAQVYDVGVDDGSYFLAMEYVEGVDLRRLMGVAKHRQGQIRLEDALRIVTELCGALHYAHEKCGQDGRPLGLVHRDVSPANVLVSYDGAIKLTDFGVVEVASAPQDPNRRIFAGKFGYISPEQCRGELLDRRSDLFALAVVLYELTTMSRLFKGKTDEEVVEKICSGRIRRPSQIRLNYPPELERIVLKGLSLDPADRYATALAMRLELETVARERKLALSAAGLTCMLKRLFPPELRGADAYDLPELIFDAPRARELPSRPRRYRLWLAGVGVAAAAFAASLLIEGGAPPPPPPEPDRDLTAGAERIEARIESGLRALETRAGGLAATPMLRAAVGTDARTLRDMVQREGLFALAPGEAVELIQWRGEREATLLRLPARDKDRGRRRARAAEAPAPAIAEDGLGVVVAVTVPVVPLYQEKGLRAALVMSSRIEGADLARDLPSGLSSATLRGPGGDLALLEAPPEGSGPPVRFALEPFQLEVTVPAPAPPPPAWRLPLRLGSIAAGVACAALFFVARHGSVRRRTPLA